MGRFIVVLLAAAASLVATPARRAQCAAAQAPSDSAVRAILDERVSARLAKGLAVGILDPDGRRRFFVAGTSGTARPLDSTSVFDIASVTKTFTGVLLADMTVRGEMSLDDPVARYLPDSVKVPSRNGRQITLLDLATHTSGLPRSVVSYRPPDLGDPYADLTPQTLYAFLASHELRRDPGTEAEYSNLAYMLLGSALARRGSVAFEELLIRRVLDPLGLRDTRVTLTPSMRDRLTAAYDAGGAIVARSRYSPTLLGHAGLLSTANDLLTYTAAHLAAALDSTGGPLVAALHATHARRRFSYGLGWYRRPLPAGDTAVARDGATRGHRSFIGFAPRRRTAVVVLSTSAFFPTDIGYHLLAPELPLAPPTLPSWVDLQPVTLPAAVLEAYVGEYALSPEAHVVIRREGVGLVLGPGGRQPRPLFVGPPPWMQLFAERKDEFFLKDIDARVHFRRGASGRVTELVVREGEKERVATRVP